MRRLALVAGLMALAGCSPPPRSVAAFKAHPAEDRQVLAACTAGVHRGVECENARAAAEQLQSDERLNHYKQSF